MAEHDITGTDDVTRRVAPRALGTAWWLPLAFVVLAVVLLLVVPLVVNQRVTHLRRDVSDRVDDALVVVNDLEAAIATELFVRVQERYGVDGRVDSIHATAVQRERDDEARLDTLVRAISPEAVVRFTELRSVDREWRASPARRDRAASPDSAPAPVQVPDVLAAAERLDDYLQVRSAEVRGSIRSLESFGVWSAVVLVPFALVSAVVVFWAGRRVLSFAHEIEHERAALARSTEARAALMRGVTHDVKNPLGAAAGYAELLQDGIAGPLTTDQQEMVTRIRRLVDVSLDTISELLELARAEEGALHFELQVTDIAALVRDTVEDYRGAARERSIVMTTDVPAERLLVRTDPQRVRRILANLLSNALKYTPRGGRVRVAVTVADAQGNAASVEVSDTGPGIPREMRERIFEDFFRLPGAKAAASGAGIGLAISRRLARLLGGDIRVDDAPDGGARFTLFIASQGAPAGLTGT